jgi:hypothetical protein
MKMKNYKWRIMLSCGRTNSFFLFHNSFHPCFFPPNLAIVGPNNELHNLESKGLEKDGSKGQLHFTCLKHWFFPYLGNLSLQVGK